jgi:hypothetical protein
MIYDHKDKETLQKFGVRAFPTFVITDAEGTELMRQVGAGPFATPEDAREWFPKISKALKSVSDLEARHKEDAENLDVAIELADTYTLLGKGDKAIELYKVIAPKVKEDDERYVDVQLAYAAALRGTMNRENQKEVAGQLGKIYDKILPDLIKAGDDRAVDPGILNARIKQIVDEDLKAARKQCVDMLEPYAEHDRILEIKYWAAVFASLDGDKDTAKTEFEAIIEAGKEDDPYVKAAKQQLDRLNK